MLFNPLDIIELNAQPSSHLESIVEDVHHQEKKASNVDFQAESEPLTEKVCSKYADFVCFDLIKIFKYIQTKTLCQKSLNYTIPHKLPSPNWEIATFLGGPHTVL